jgi:hypothetical protein
MAGAIAASPTPGGDNPLPCTRRARVATRAARHDYLSGFTERVVPKNELVREPIHHLTAVHVHVELAGTS